MIDPDRLQLAGLVSFHRGWRRLLFKNNRQNSGSWRSGYATDCKPGAGGFDSHIPLQFQMVRSALVSLLSCLLKQVGSTPILTAKHDPAHALIVKE